MTDVCYVISHGFAARMIMQTNLLGLLAQEGKTVALIAPDKEDENLRLYCSNYRIKLYQFSPRSSFWSAQYHEARKYFLEDIRLNPALWEKHIRATRYNKSKNPWSHIRPRFLILLHHVSRWIPRLRYWYLKRESKHLASEEADSLIKNIDPQVLVVTYPVNFSEAMMLKAAKRSGSKTVIHLLSWDNITSKGHFPQLADEYLAWGPIMKRELISHYNIPEERISECGVPHFDLHIKSRQNPMPGIYLKELGLEPDKPYLFFGMSSPRFAPREIEIVEWLANKVRDDTFGDEMQLVVRPHPQNVQGAMADRTWLPRLESISGKRVGIDFPDLVTSNMPWSMQEVDMKRLSHLLAGCSVSFNSGSTLSIDALMCKVPVILTAFDGIQTIEYWESARRLIDYTHLHQLIALGGITVVKSFEEMSKMTLKYLKDPQHELEKRLYTLEQQCSNHKDFATHKIVSTLSLFFNFKETIHE